jgi:hypothetical protein
MDGAVQDLRDLRVLVAYSVFLSVPSVALRYLQTKFAASSTLPVPL